MLWSLNQQYQEHDFKLEQELEDAIWETKDALFGKNSLYLNIKKRIGQKFLQRSIPDGYLLDLSSSKHPRLYVVEVELATHDTIRHIASQLLKINLSYENDQLLVKKILLDAIEEGEDNKSFCLKYLQNNEYFPNLDRLLDYVIYEEKFCALVIIDKIEDKLDTIISSKFNFPIEIISFKRFKDKESHCLFEFEPFLSDIQEDINVEPGTSANDLDTIIVPAQKWGFDGVFLKQNQWYAVRMRAAMIPNIKYIAAYQTSPVSAITHIAKIAEIKPYKDSGKYIIYFDGPAQKIKALKLKKDGRVKAPQAPRYTNLDKLQRAKSIEVLF